MASTARLYKDPVSPTPETVKLATLAVRDLNMPSARFALVDNGTNTTIELNEQMFELLREMLINLAQNRPISLMPLSHELTTHKAAEVLGVSRGFILSLLKNKELKFRMVGTHRRVRLEDVLEYRAKMDSQSNAAMDELVAIEEDLGLE